MGFLPAGRLPPNSTRQENSAKMRQNEDTKKLSNNPVMKASISLEADLLKNRLADFELNHQMSSDPQWMRPMSAFALSQCTKLLQKWQKTLKKFGSSFHERAKNSLEGQKKLSPFDRSGEKVTAHFQLKISQNEFWINLLHKIVQIRYGIFLNIFFFFSHSRMGSVFRFPNGILPPSPNSLRARRAELLVKCVFLCISLQCGGELLADIDRESFEDFSLLIISPILSILCCWSRGLSRVVSSPLCFAMPRSADDFDLNRIWTIFNIFWKVLWRDLWTDMTWPATFGPPGPLDATFVAFASCLVFSSPHSGRKHTKTHYLGTINPQTWIRNNLHRNDFAHFGRAK